MARTLVRLFFLVATLEALSWVGLLSGMYLKWVARTTERGVQVFGPIHGGVFVAYVVLTLAVSRVQRWSTGTTLLALACSVPPFATLVFEWWAARTGRLRVGAATRRDEPVTVG